ncbi:DUF6004 family protein [Streptomyces sp. NPDC056501]|uniref:DUF6004 family protein n=1 Tax=Streptomyces sp. NPDC056501 TaxID=3345841 RepID=UPI0036922E33
MGQPLRHRDPAQRPRPHRRHRVLGPPPPPLTPPADAPSSARPQRKTGHRHAAAEVFAATNLPLAWYPAGDDNEPSGTTPKIFFAPNRHP